jgi:glycogen synthase
MSISRGNVPFLGRFPRLIDTFLLMAEDFLLTKLQVGTPVEYEKQPIQLLQLVTTLSISHAQNRARSSFAMARKGAMKWNASPWTFLPIVLAKRCS